MSQGSIDPGYFDPDAVTQEKFLGRVVESRIQEGTVGKLAGETVWYLEVENISRPMSYNFSKELLPARGKGSLWVRQITAWRNIGIPISEVVIPTLKGKYFWFTVGDVTYITKDKEEKILTRNFFVPVGIPTEEEIDRAHAKRNLTREEIPVDDEEPPWEEPQDKGATQDQESLILSLADGKTHEEFLAEAASFRDELGSVFSKLVDKTLLAELILKKKLEIRGNKYVAKTTKEVK